MVGRSRAPPFVPVESTEVAVPTHSETVGPLVRQTNRPAPAEPIAGPSRSAFYAETARTGSTLPPDRMGQPTKAAPFHSCQAAVSPALVSEAQAPWIESVLTI